MDIEPKELQSTTIFELLLDQGYIRCVEQTADSNKYVFTLTDYIDELKKRDEHLAFQMVKLFRQLFLNDHLVAVKLKDSNPTQVRFLFGFDYPELRPEEKQYFELVPAKLLWKEIHLN